MNKKTITALVVLFLTMAVFMIMVACEFDKPLTDNESVPGLNINVPLFKLDYDETMSTYALQWPGSTIHNPGMAKTMDGDMLFLLDYQATHQTFTIDDSGYFSWSKENIEGDESIRVPIEIWEQTKNIRPVTIVG